MTGLEERKDGQVQDAERKAPDVTERGLSSGFVRSLTLILIGATIGVFWREVFQLTIRAVEALR
ncbi:hypothetical protein [Brevundimonas sp. NIBR11]|uniref:hypothetical protein n=1 Tax=Brevundimonas sp. NIBR11 TaxID=3015999 RepID=UPI0022F0D670|nr:hypothetical protein [Brevundimonas sp. NIBR11]WGM31634.1 hypothetical protein KKHFBJBL_01881 [Brevundimonas sp. NIBR11]